MGVLVNDNERCLCGHGERVHSFNDNRCLFITCDCTRFTLSYKELIERAKDQKANSLDEALLATAQMHIVSDIRWLHSQGFTNYSVRKHTGRLVLIVDSAHVFEGRQKLTSNNFYSESGITDMYSKEYVTTERRKQDRRKG